MSTTKTWIYPQRAEPQIEAALAAFSPLQRQILARRGLQDRAQVEAYLSRRNAPETDPFLLLGMEQAIGRLVQAQRRGECVVVYGDYDADGVTATVLLFEALRSAGIEADWYIPDRFEEGYGLNRAALEDLRNRGASLLITVDCGVRSLEEVAAARSFGLDMIITDHHLPGDEMPHAIAVINPSQQGDRYPFKGLAGVGIAYKLAEAIHQELEAVDPESMLDLVAIGTVADLAPLNNENRFLVSAGLDHLNQTRRPGLLALIDAAGFKLGGLNATSIAFGLGPRLNAAGRLTSAREAVELLLAADPHRASVQADRLNYLNRERRRITQRNVDLALELLEETEKPRSVVLVADHRFHEGVIGLAASRIAELTFRPTLLMVPEAGLAKGSARSIAGFHITDALEECKDLLVRFGGHAQAAGFALPEENIAELDARLEQEASRAFIDRALVPTLELDGVVEFTELQAELMEFFDRLEPCGQANPYPTLATLGATVLSKRAVGAEGRHLKLTLGQGGVVFDAIAFRKGELVSALSNQVDVAYRFERNEFQGVVSFQLNVEDIRPAQGMTL